MSDHLPDLTPAKTWLEEIRTDLLALRTDSSGPTAAMLEKHATTLGDIIARAKITATPAVALRVRQITNEDELSDIIASFGDMGSAWVLEDEDGDDKAYMYGRSGQRSLQGLL